MGLMPGYKQTEVGLIPEDWGVVDYLSFGQVIDGDRGIQYPGAGDLRVFGHCLFLNAGNVTRTGFRFADCQFISAEKDKKLNKGKLTRGDVVLTTRGTLGNFAYFDETTPFESIRINSGMVILRNTSLTVTNAYLYLTLRSRIVASQIERLSFGSAQPQLTVKGISTLKIPLPPTKTEQDAIAEAFGDADALTESLEQLIAKKRDLKQGAMQELLTGKRRLPGFNGEWEVKRLGDICEIAMGRTPPRLNPAYWGRGYKWLSIADLRTKVVAESKEEITPLAAADMQVISKGTLLMSFKLSIGRLCFAGCDLYTNEAICSFNDPKANAEFLYYILGRTDFSLYGKQAVKGYTLNKESLKQVVVCVPSEPEQAAIVAILCDMDAEIAALEAKLAKARQIKQGMMHNLLTGRIRLV